VMLTKLSSFNFFILQDRDSSVSRPLRVSGVLRSLFRVSSVLSWGRAQVRTIGCDSFYVNALCGTRCWPLAQ
jgi:hypothetical protein